MIMLGFYRLFAAIVLAILCGIVSQVASFESCQYAPFGQSKLEVVIYLTGGTSHDNEVLKLMCDLKNKIPSYVVPITFKIGANVTYQNNKYTCIDYKYTELPCQALYRFTCMSGLLTPPKFYDFLCCVANKNNDFDQCVSDFDYVIPLEDCLAGKLKPYIDPEKNTFDNSKEIAGKGVNKDVDLQPYYTFNGMYDKCTSEQASSSFAETICTALSNEARQKVPACQ